MYQINLLMMFLFTAGTFYFLYKQSKFTKKRVLKIIPVMDFNSTNNEVRAINRWQIIFLIGLIITSLINKYLRI